MGRPESTAPAGLPDPVLTDRFGAALAFALERHREQARKGTKIPYMSHLLQVCGLVLEAGGDEDQAIAALLHDSIEDAPEGEAGSVRSRIRARFGERVLELVEACTDTDVKPKPPWQKRKEDYLAHLPDVHPDALLVSAADKLHNATSILHDLQHLHDQHEDPDRLWSRFNASRDQTLWYYRELVNAYRTAGWDPFVGRLDDVVTAIEGAARAPTSPR